MKYRLILAALGAVFLMSGCVVPVGRYHGDAGYYRDGGHGYDCRGRESCGRHDHDDYRGQR